MSTPTSRDAALATLCRQCGLCCDGTLFTRVPLSDAEAERIAGHGLPVERGADHRPALRQRCGALVGFDCRVYADRPSPCRAFRCHQLIALGEGEASLDEAAVRVRQAQALLGALAAALHSADSGGELLREARRQAKAGLASPEAHDALQALETFLRRHFTGRNRL